MFIINKIQKWMDTMAGQTFMQYAYSWGAAIVILGSLFKITHMDGADMMLFLGMGTEVFVFILSGFERVTEKAPETPEEHAAAPSAGQVSVPGGSVTVVQGVAPAAAKDLDPDALAHGAALSAAAANLASAGQAAAEAQLVLSQLKNGTAMPLPDQSQIRATDPAAIEEAVKNYATELTELTEVLARVKDQAQRMSTDSEEMENLNRTLTGIATVYELQLRNISKQVNTIEQIDEQTRRMAEQIAELNNVYARMIQALTVNMGGAPGGVSAANKG